MATSKTKFGVVKTILIITVLIVIVQIIAVSFISSQEGFEERNKRDHLQIHERDFIYEATHSLVVVTQQKSIDEDEDAEEVAIILLFDKMFDDNGY